MVIFRFVIILPLVLFTASTGFAGGGLLRFRLLPGESRILTHVAHPFGIVKGELTLGGGEVRGMISDLDGTGSVELTINAASYKSNVRFRDRDVQKNYLEMEEYPVITFTSTGVGISRRPELLNGAWGLAVRGMLELHGVRKEIRVPVKMTRQGKKIAAEGSATILFKDFNIAIPSLLSLRANDRVEVSFRFVGVQMPQ